MNESASKVPKIFQKNQTKQNKTGFKKLSSVEKKLIVLMNREIAYEISLQAIKNQNRGEIIYQNKNKGLILLKEDSVELKINIKPLTKNTTEIELTSTIKHDILKNIIKYIKLKEYIFLDY